MSRAIALVLTILIAACAGTEAQGGEVVTIFYIPIGVETFIPITPQNIEEHYARYGVVRYDDVTLQRVLRVLAAAPKGRFEDQAVRVKLVLPNKQTILIDNQGGVRANAADFGLSTHALSEIRAELERITIPRSK